MTNLPPEISAGEEWDLESIEIALWLERRRRAEIEKWKAAPIYKNKSPDSLNPEGDTHDIASKET